MAGAREIRAGKAYVELSTKDKMTRGLARAQARLQAFGAVCERMGRSLLKVGGGVLAVLGAASKVFADFEKQMAMVSTMLDRPVAHMARFKEAVRDMAVSSGQSTETITKGLYDILSASVAPEKALGFLQVALHAAEGGMTDVATATKGMIRILRAYDMDAAQAADISDTLFTVVKRGVITYEELAEHVGTVAPSARAAGLTLQQLSAAIATVVAVEEPARAMTALRQAIFEAAESGTDLLSFVRRFKDADLAKVIAAGIPKRAAAGVVILAGNLKLLDENLAAMAARAGAGEEAYEKMAGTLTRAFNQAKQAVVVAAGRIGEALAPVLKDWLSGAKEAIESWSAWIRQNRELVDQYVKLALKIAAWTVGLGAALIVVGKLAFGVKGLIGVIAILTAHPLVAAFVGVAAVIGGVCYAIHVLTTRVAHLTHAAREYREEGDRQRIEDQGRLARLDQLSKKMYRTDEEMKEAAKLTKTLTDRYGGLGIIVNKFTNSLLVASQAQEQLNQAMKKQLVLDLKSELQEAVKNLKELEEATELRWLPIPHILRGKPAQELAAGKKIADLRQRIADLESGKETPAFKPPGAVGRPGRGIPREKEKVVYGEWLEEFAEAERKQDEARKRRISEEARLRWASIDEEARLRDEIARAEIEATKEGIEKRLALLKLEYRQRLEQAAMAGADLALVKRLYDARRRAILAGAETEKVARRFQVRGQFGGLGAERMGGGNTTDRIAQASEETAKNTKRLVTEARRGGLVFG